MAGQMWGILGCCCGDEESNPCNLTGNKIYLWFETSPGGGSYTDGPHEVDYDSDLGGWYYQLNITKYCLDDDCLGEASNTVSLHYGIKLNTSNQFMVRGVHYAASIGDATQCFYKISHCGDIACPWVSTAVDAYPETDPGSIDGDYYLTVAPCAFYWVRFMQGTGTACTTANLLFTGTASASMGCNFAFHPFRGVKGTRTTTAP